MSSGKAQSARTKPVIKPAVIASTNRTALWQRSPTGLRWRYAANEKERVRASTFPCLVCRAQAEERGYFSWMRRATPPGRAWRRSISRDAISGHPLRLRSRVVHRIGTDWPLSLHRESVVRWLGAFLTWQTKPKAIGWGCARRTPSHRQPGRLIDEGSST
jgi:hypothetical protein